MSDETSDIQQNPFEPFLGSFILETLTLGMYGESRNAIREYVQNAYDSILAAVQSGLISHEEGEIHVKMGDNSLVIRDNGIGLRENLAVEALTSIGASRKDYRCQAGFRGIGRLAGLVFCNILTFKTKAKGEVSETVVQFNAKGMRHDMSPNRAGLQSLEKLLKKNISFRITKGHSPDDHYFEVSLQDLHEPPSECTDESLMVDYLSQIAPVPYNLDFLHGVILQAAAQQRSTRIDEVRIFVDGIGGSVQVFKPYEKTFLVGKASVSLADIRLIDSDTGHWWGWVGLKTEPGAYKDETEKAIRIRVRNIQIDGTQLMAKIFSDVDGAPSYARFNDWYIGEIFVHEGKLIPNARRDGFEEEEGWVVARQQILKTCKVLGEEAYVISRQSQMSLKQLAKETKKIEDEVEKLIVPSRSDLKIVVDLASQINKLQRKVTRAAKDSDYETAAQFRSLEARLLTLQRRALGKVDAGQEQNPRGASVAASQKIVDKLVHALRDQLDPRTFERVMQIIENVVGEVSL